MGRRETGALRAVMDQDTDIVGQFGMMTGAQPEDKAFYQVAADLVPDCHRQDEHQRPPPAFYTEIEDNEHQEKEIEGHPEFHFPEKRKDKVTGSACPVLVDF